MKKIKVIYNPSSGRQIIQKRIDNIILKLIDKGYTLNKFITKKKDDALNETIRCLKEDWDGIIVCGGDGTVNEVATGIVKGGKKIPVAILPSGTVNDFASYLKLPNNSDEFCKMIERWDTIDVDLGKVNDKYFVNVAAGGLLTNVAHQVSSEYKTVFGRLAYYLEGLKEIPKSGFRPIKVKIMSEEYSSSEDILLFLISNSKHIGGFKRIAPEAEIKDGFLDCLFIKKSDFQSLITIFINILKGEHINHKDVIYFKTKKIFIDCNEEVQVDIDGEYAGNLPSLFEILPNSFRIFKYK